MNGSELQDGRGEKLPPVRDSGKPSWLALVANGTFREMLADHRERIEHEGMLLVPLAPPGGLNAQIRALRSDLAVIFGPGPGLDAELFVNAPRLKVVALAASGYESVDVAAATRAGVAVTNAPTPLGSEAVADLAFGLIICVARAIPQCHSALMTAHTAERTMGRIVWGKTLGIVGLGSIGKAVARRARGFDMQVLAYNRSWDEEDQRFARAHQVARADLQTLLQASDFVSLHLRAAPSTHAIIGAQELALMKPTAYMINTARASLVDEKALYEALSTAKIAGAALDTVVDNGIENPLLDLPTVVATPHLGNRCVDSVHDVIGAAIDSASAVLRGQRPDYLINPEMYDLPC